MKGDESITATISTLIFIAGVIVTIIILKLYFVSYSGGVVTPIENIEAVEAAYTVESCFKNLSGGNYIANDFLDAHTKISKDINDMDDYYNFNYVGVLCGVPYPPIEAEIKDIENGNTWIFEMPSEDFLTKTFSFTKKQITRIFHRPKEKSKPKHSIWIPILYRDYVLKSGGDIVMEMNKRYVVEYGSLNGKTSLDIYPLEMYMSKKPSENLIIDDNEDIYRLKEKINGLDTSIKRSLLVMNNYRDVTADEIKTDAFKIIKILKSEVHMGRLNVRI